jgi:hypothetical protein
MMERGARTGEDQRGSLMAFYRIGCYGKRHQKAIASEQEHSILPGEVSLGTCGVSKYSVYKGRYTEDGGSKWVGKMRRLKGARNLLL